MKILHLYQPNILFCCETKLLAKQVNLEGRQFNLKFFFSVDINGIGGGLTLFWSSDVNVEIKSYSSHHIDAVVYNESGKVWRCTRFMVIHKPIKNTILGHYWRG